MEDLDFIPLKFMFLSILHNVLSFKVMFFCSLVKNNRLRGFAVSFKAVKSEIAEKMVKSYFSI